METKNVQRPRYVDRWNANAALQPFEITDAHMYTFAFRSGNADALQVLCNRYLNDPLGVSKRFSPLQDIVFFGFTWIRWVTSKYPPFSDWGGSTELELAIWIPVKDATSPMTIRWFAPYMFVNSAMATWQGREIYGLPKEAGCFEPDFSGDFKEPPHEFCVSGLAVTKFDTTAYPKPAPLVHVYRPPDGAAPVVKQWKTFDEAAEEAAQIILRTEADTPRKLLPPQGKLAALKQFPDEREGQYAAYQRALEIPCTVHLDGFKPGGLAMGYRLQLNAADSHPIRTDTGLPGNDDKAVFGAWLRCNFTMEDASYL